MSESFMHGLKVTAYLVWLVAVGVAMVRDIHRIGELYRSIQHTQVMTDELAVDSQGIVDTAHLIRGGNREVQFLQGLMNLLPRNKSFIRTQKAMAEEVEALRYKVGRRVKNDLQVLVDTRANKLYVKKGLTLLWEADCSVGKGGILKDKQTGRRWEFVTPRGQFDIHDKIVAPVWTKPDWAFVEEHKPVPPPEDPSRHVAGELGAYVFNLGDGYLIHGTLDETVLGHPASHGCVRLSAVDLKRLYETVPRGTRVYIY